MSDSSVEFAKHLRTTHFALMATSAALLGALLFGTPSRTQSAARQEISELLSIRAAMRDGLGWEAVHNEVWPALQQAEQCIEIRNTATGDTTRHLLRLAGPDFAAANLGKRYENFGISKAVLKQRLSLNELRNLWDDMAQQKLRQVQPFAPTSWQPLVDRNLQARSKEREECGDEPEARLSIVAESFEYRYRITFERGPKLHSKDGSRRRLKVHQKAKTTATGRSLLESLLLGVRETKPVSFSPLERAKVFEEAFPNLLAAARNFSTETPELIEGLLDLMAAGQRREIEVLGLSLDLESLARWGMWLLVGTQLYFVTHLRGALKHLSPDFPWIGLYRDPWLFSELTLVLSTCVLPAAAAVALSFAAMKASASSAFKAAALTGLAVSLVLVALTALTLWQVRRRLLAGHT